jgi:hypothetical protein
MSERQDMFGRSEALDPVVRAIALNRLETSSAMEIVYRTGSGEYEHEREVKPKVKSSKVKHKWSWKTQEGFFGSSLILLSGGGLGTYFRAGVRSARCDLAILDLTITIYDHRL